MVHFIDSTDSFEEREQELIEKEHQWEQEKGLLEREAILNKDIEDFSKSKKLPKKRIPTSKKLIWFLFINCTIIEIVVIFVTLQSLKLVPFLSMMPDFSPLIALIGAVVSEAIGYAVYAIKSAKENSIGGITYDMAMRDINETQQDINKNNDAVG